MAKVFLLLSCLTIFLSFCIFSLLWFNLFFGTQGKPHRILAHFIHYLYQIFPQAGPEQSQDASTFPWATRTVSVARLRTGQPGVGLCFLERTRTWALKPAGLVQKSPLGTYCPATMGIRFLSLFFSFFIKLNNQTCLRRYL